MEFEFGAGSDTPMAEHLLIEESFASGLLCKVILERLLGKEVVEVDIGFHRSRIFWPLWLSKQELIHFSVGRKSFVF